MLPRGRAKNDTLTEIERHVTDQALRPHAPVNLVVRPDGRIEAGGRSFRCALGPAGVVSDKKEGDGATPAGVFPLRRVLYRADRAAPPETGLPAAATEPNAGWCDDPADPAYNRPVTLPYPASTERLAREDEVYDILVVLGHNDDPPVPGAGSAIFFHLARENYSPTEGCVAVCEADMREILALCGPGATMTILAE